MENNNIEIKSKAEIACEKIGTFLGIVANWFLSSLWIWLAWSVLAPHLNAPEFTYWEIFVMRMAFTNIMDIFWQKK